MNIEARTINASIERALSKPASIKHFLSRRKNHPALSAFATPLAVTSFLMRASASGDERRSDVATALMKLHREEPHELWSSMLLHGFMPALWALYLRIHRQLAATSESVTFIFEIFLGAARALSADCKLAASRLVLETRKTVYRRLARLFAERAEDFDVGAAEAVDGSPSPESLVAKRRTLEALRSRVAQYAQREPLDELVLLVAPFRDGGSFRQWVHDHFPEESEGQRARVYRCLRQRRLRTIQRVRERMGEDTDRLAALLPRE